jgi:hypothetical protein
MASESGEIELAVNPRVEFVIVDENGKLGSSGMAVRIRRSGPGAIVGVLFII